MTKHIAKAISILFHPLVMPTIGIYVIFNSSFYLSLMPSEGQKVIYLIIFVSTFVLPIIMLPIFMLQKVIKSLEMTQTQERFIPLLVTAIFYFFSYFTLFRLKAPIFISSYILGGAITIALLTIINTKWKISIHSAGIGGLIGMIIALTIIFKLHSSLYFTEAILVAGLVATSRLYLGAHNTKQILAGFALSTIVVFTTILIINT